MRVRILKPIAGIVQGVSLAYLRLGLTYDIDATLGRYLVSTGAAEAVSSIPARVVPQKSPEDFTEIISGVSDTDVAEAADKPKRKRSARRKNR